MRKMNPTKIVKTVLIPFGHSSISHRKVWGKLNKHYSPKPLQMVSWQVYAVSIR